jgi:hypothetical protein
MQRLCAIGLTLTAIVLTGCAKKPPECSDPDVLKTIQSMLVSNAKETLQTMSPYTGNETRFQDDPTKIQDSYYQGMNIEVVNIVSDGYNEQAKKNSCKGKLSVSLVSGKKLSRAIEYSTQRTEDKDGNFVVEVQEFAPFIQGVASDLHFYYYVKRYTGEWTGNYSCAGISGAQSSSQGPFSMPVALVVSETSDAKLERTTLGGGSESLIGTVGEVVKLVGSGQNSPEHSWRTSFEGTVKGTTLTAKGEIRSPAPESQLLRTCELNLQHAVR